MEAAPINRDRYGRILIFFARLIFHLVVWDLIGGRLSGLRQPIQRSRPQRFRRWARRFRALAIDMGGVMIKLGQFLSSRVDVLPLEITEELAGLQDEVPAVAQEAIAVVLQQELGDLSTHFAYFDWQPLAAASLGQAHRARLHDSENEGGGKQWW